MTWKKLHSLVHVKVRHDTKAAERERERESGED